MNGCFIMSIGAEFACLTLIELYSVMGTQAEDTAFLVPPEVVDSRHFGWQPGRGEDCG